MSLSSYEVLTHLTEHHLCEIYGSYGAGKSRFAAHIALEAQKLGVRVLFIDTEMGLPYSIIAQFKNYLYVGDSLSDLEDAVAWAKEHRDEFDMLVVDSVGTPVYLEYIRFEETAGKLKAFQKLAAAFRDMVRFARGECGVDFDPKNPLKSRRKALSVAVNHCLSEFSRVAREESDSEPLAPFGGSIHRIPKVILRVEPEELTAEYSRFRILTYKTRNLPKNLVIGRYVIDAEGVKVEWNLKLLGLKPLEKPPYAGRLLAKVLAGMPRSIMENVEAVEEAGHMVLRLKQHISYEDFLKLSNIVRGMGGDYVQGEGCFKIPLREGTGNSFSS